MRSLKNRLANAAVAALVLLCAPWAAAQLIPPGVGTVLTPGTPVVVTADGPVQVQFIAGSAVFQSQLFLDSPANGLGVIFIDDVTFPGTIKSLGSFTAGTELVFRNFVVNTGNSFFTGPASRNPDGIVHARVTLFTDAELDAIEAAIPIANGTILRNGTNPTVLIGFEDIFGGGDLDYNDLMYVFNNLTPVPEPSHAVLLFAGLALIAWRFGWYRGRPAKVAARR